MTRPSSPSTRLPRGAVLPVRPRHAREERATGLVTVTLWWAHYRGPDPATTRSGHRRLVREILGHVVGVPQAQVVLGTTGDGKPTLAAPAGRDGVSMHFNASHTGPHLVVATSTAGPVGVDAEQARPLAWDALAPRVLSARELAAFTAVAAHQRSAALLRIWTRKESLLKADGVGLGRPATTLEVDPTPGPDAGQGPHERPDPLRHNAGRWHLYDASRDDVHASVASAVPATVVHAFWLDGPGGHPPAQT